MSEFLKNNREVILDIAQQAAVSAAVEASEAVLSYWPSPTNPNYDAQATLEIVEKDGGLGDNFVTDADHLSGDVIRNAIGRYPELDDIGFRTEETKDAFTTSSFWWNIDEIDGTANFTHGSDQFGISIGLHDEDGLPVEGILAFPARQEIIVGRKGQGVKLLNFSGEELVDLTANTTNLPSNPEAKNLFTAYDLGYKNRAQKLGIGALRLADQVSAVKCFHSTSYAMGELLLGKLDAYFASSPTIYDIGASAAAIEALGGKVSDLFGEPLNWGAAENGFLAGRTPQIHDQVLQLLNHQ